MKIYQCTLPNSRNIHIKTDNYKDASEIIFTVNSGNMNITTNTITLSKEIYCASTSFTANITSVTIPFMYDALRKIE